MNTRTIVILSQGFEEIEAAAPTDILRRAGATVDVAGIGGLRITGSHGITYEANVLLDDADPAGYGLVILPGGMPGAKNIGECARARELASAVLKAGNRVAAICAAPVMTLGAWGVLSGRRATCYPGMETQFPKDVTFCPDRVVQDGQITTSRGPGTALEFGLHLAGLLFGEDMQKKIDRANACTCIELLRQANLP